MLKQSKGIPKGKSRSGIPFYFKLSANRKKRLTQLYSCVTMLIIIVHIKQTDYHKQATERGFYETES